MMLISVYNSSPYPLKYATDGSCGLDLHANLSVERFINPGQRWKVNTGIHVELPPHHVGQIWARSGLCVHHGIGILDGIIDTDYRGEIAVTLFNFGEQTFKIMPGDRIGQLVVLPVVRVAAVEVDSVDDLTPTRRGAGGFGSTGR